MFETMTLRRWTARFVIKPHCLNITKFPGEITLGGFKLRYDDKRYIYYGELSKELPSRDTLDVRRIFADFIERELLSYLILVTECGMEFNPYDMQLRYEEPGGSTGIISDVFKIFVLSVNEESPTAFKGKLEKYKNRLKKLGDIEREWLLRALRFWNRGAIDYDKIDKFINFYIALEIFAKRILNKSDLNNETLNEIYEEYGINFEYNVNDGDRSVYDIRRHLFHGGATSSKKIKELDEAIKASILIADRFGQDLFKLVKTYIENKLR